MSDKFVELPRRKHASVEAKPRTRIVAKCNIQHGANPRTDRDGSDVCDVTVYEPGAELPFDPQAEGLVEGVHFERVF